MEELISVREAAERLGVTRQYILYLIGRDRIEGARKIGHQWAIPAGAKVVLAPGRPLRTLEIPRAGKKR